MNHRKLVLSAGLLLAGLFSLALPGCAPEVLPATQHDPISPSAVQIYQKEPAKYELLATLSIPMTADMKWDEKGDSTPGFEALKAKAAALGGNGVLLTAPFGAADITVTAGYKNEYYQVPMKGSTRTVVAQAIYMIKK